jgi:TolB protein
MRTILVLGLLSTMGLPQPPGEGNWQAQEAAYLKNIKQLTFDYARAGEAYFSPDGKLIIFQAEEKGENPFYQIFVQDLQTGRARRVSPGAGRTTCGYFRPDGRRIIFASAHTNPHFKEEAADELRKRAEEATSGRRRRYEWVFDPYMRIYEADLDGGNLRLLTDAPGYNAEGSHSRDGKQIVFCSNRDGNLELYIMAADGGNVRKLTNAPGCYNGGPFFSPDGQRVIFRADRHKKDELQVYVINADGTDERQLTQIDGVAWAPFWHPDGKHIVYTSAVHKPNQRPNYDLYWMNVETGKTTRLTFAPGQDVLPVFSPDGKKLMWTSNRDGLMPGTQIFVADFEMPTD